jgi:chorismate mutase-like protein
MSDLPIDELEKYRAQIDILDRRLLDLLNERTAIVERIGRIKQERKLAVYEPKREDQVYANILSHNHGPLSAEAVKRIFERIIDEMRTLQQSTLEKSRVGTRRESC